MFFAAISGSGPATVAAVGGMVIPSMLEAGYDKKFTLAVIAAAGSIGVIIPPSIPMVIYSVSTGQSVSELFMAGFIPGILIGLTLILYCHFYCKNMDIKEMKNHFPGKMQEKLRGMPNGHLFVRLLFSEEFMEVFLHQQKLLQSLLHMDLSLEYLCIRKLS